MPILQDDSDIIQSSSPISELGEVNPIKITSNTNTSIAVDNRWISRMDLLTHIEGSLWIVDYYKQILTRDSQTTGQQISVSAPFQQYKRIKRFHLRVSSPLTTSQDDDQKTTTVTGEATLTSFFVPNDGDMFVADLGSGLNGIFTVNSTTKLSIYRESAYQLRYTLLTTDTKYLADLDSKVVEDTYFYPQRVVTGDNPIVANSEFKIIVDMEKEHGRLTEYYFKRFFSKEYQTLLLPNQDKSIYDPFLVKFVLSSFDTYDAETIRYIRRLNDHDDDNLECDSVWDAIKHRSRSYLSTSFKTCGLVSTKLFSKLPTTNSIRYTGIQYCIYPLDPTLTVDNTLHDNTKLANIEFIDTEAPRLTMADILSLKGLPERNTVLFKSVNEDSYYIFSQSFYDESDDTSVFEAFVSNYIDNKTDNIALLHDLVSNVNKMKLIEQFYYIPILLLMIRSVIRGV